MSWVISEILIKKQGMSIHTSMDHIRSMLSVGTAAISILMHCQYMTLNRSPVAFIMPPPIHQTFEARNFVICSFVPRMYDYHPLSVPVPYNHSNIDSDEVLYYVAGDFMSRKHVTKGMITLHPGGIPHGPHPGTVEKSLGQKETKELAVMVDTFRPLMLTKNAVGIMSDNYYKSWIE